MHYRVSKLNNKLSKKKNFPASNIQLILNFTHPVLNNINFHKILIYKSHNFPLISFIPYKTFKYITLGRRLLSDNQFSKQLNINDSPPCYYSDNFTQYIYI